MKSGEKIIREFPKPNLYKPEYHYSAPYGWMNDPNGTVYWKGRWHLFYQFFPDWSSGVSMAHWGHAVSADLVHWDDLSIALEPEADTYDQKGCWSGTSIVDGNRVIANYHAHQSGNCIAISQDEMLESWYKLPSNPYVDFDPEKTYDPCIWKRNNKYYSISGRITNAHYGDGRDQESGGKDIAYLYSSDDLENWEYVDVFYLGGVFTNPGEDCACPDFFKIGNRYMLLFLSHNQGAQYYLGSYSDNKFYPEAHGRMNFTNPKLERLGLSGDLAAPIAWEGLNGRRVMIGWVAEGRTYEAMHKSNWAGIMSLPRDLALDEQGSLLISPIPELQSLRTNHNSTTNITLNDGIPANFNIGSNTKELHLSADMKNSKILQLDIFSSEERKEKTMIILNRLEKTLTIDPSVASINPDVTGILPQIAPFELDSNELLDLTIFIDKSIIEVFANNKQCVTKRIYPQLIGNLNMDITSFDGNAFVNTLEIWDMKSIWKHDIKQEAKIE